MLADSSCSFSHFVFNPFKDKSNIYYAIYNFFEFGQFLLCHSLFHVRVEKNLTHNQTIKFQTGPNFKQIVDDILKCIWNEK